MDQLLTSKGKLFALMFLFFMYGCGSRVDIEKVTFGRGAIAVRLNKKVLVRRVSISEEQKNTVSREIGHETDEIFIDLNWQKGKEYRIGVKLKSGTSSLVTICHAPEQPSALVLSSFDLEDVDPYQLWDYSYIGGVVSFSPGGEYLAVGSEKSYLRLIDVKNSRVLWSKRIGEGRIVAMAFSPDGRYLAMGEQSRDAFLYLYDIKGQLLWKFRASKDVGTVEPGQPKYNLPVVNSLTFGFAGGSWRIYLAARHYLGCVNSCYRHKGRVYCLDLKSGRVIWGWPTKGCMDGSPDALRMDGQGKYLVLTNYWKGNLFDKSIYCLNALDGRLVWGWDFEHYFPEKRLGIWHGADISADGRYIAAFSSDGRGFLLKNRELIDSGGERGLVWVKSISTPIIINGLTVHGFPALAKIGQGYVAFLTGNTHVMRGKRKPIIEHPSANSLFVFDFKGNLKWTADVGGASYTDRIHTSQDGRYMILPIRYNRIGNKSLVHGLYLFDNSRVGGVSRKLVWFFHTDGMCLTADISRDGKYIAALEYPVDVDIRDDFQNVRGKHKVYILR